jgi:hypothetical protein
MGNLFLNPKIQIVSTSWLERMVEDSVIPAWFFVQATENRSATLMVTIFMVVYPTQLKYFELKG